MSAIEVGSIVDIKPRCVREVRKLYQFTLNQQFRVLLVEPKDKWVWTRVLVQRSPEDSGGFWLWQKQLHKVPGKKIAHEWKAAPKLRAAA